AYIGGATVSAEGDVEVEAHSSEEIISVSAAIGGGGTVGIAGSAGVQVLSITTRAFIGDDIPTDASSLTSGVADVVAEGNVILNAADETEIDLISGTVAAAGTVAVGASAAITVVDKTTEAYIGRNAAVTGKGTASSNVNAGRFGLASFTPDTDDSEFGGVDGTETEVSSVDRPDLTSPDTGGGFSDLSDESSGDAIANDSLGGVRSIGAIVEPHRGVIVTATNKDDIETIGASGGGGTVGVNVVGGVNVIETHTSAFIAEGADVNQEMSGADAGQDVLVAAANDYHHMGLVATASGGLVGVAVNAEVTVASMTTTAYIDDGATVDAQGNVEVTARSHEDLISFAFSVGV
ncbi:MAG: hypothetical protein L0221_17970, partial [Chloroflexi bacterium]|nr:hypothetical protein [Chloroflexota bacterium]